MDLLDEAQRLIQALEERSVPYALAGAMAVAVHGAPRATTDIDLVVRPEDVERARDVARGRGFTFDALPMKFEDGMEVVRMSKISADEVLTLDLLLVDRNLEEVWAGRERRRGTFGEFWVVSRDALIRMKTLANRPQDIADIRRLEGLDR